MHSEDIKAALRKRGWTLADIAKELDICPSAVSHALTRQRSRRVEETIANKIGLPLQEVWPQRYTGVSSHANTPIRQQTGSIAMLQPQRYDTETLQTAGPFD